METKITVKTVVTRTQTIQLSDEDIKHALLNQYNMQGGEVVFDESSYGGINGATLIITSREEMS